MTNTSLIYIKKDGKYLMLHRVKKENDINRDKWIGIGGKFEEGESPEDCVRREVFEEVGLALGKVKYRAIITFVSGNETEYMHLFTSDDFSGEPKSDCDEGVPEWIDIHALYDKEMWEGDKIFLRLIENDEQPFFSLKFVYDGSRLVSHTIY